MWVADGADSKLYAYRMSDKAHDSSKDFDTLVGAGNEYPTGIWSDGTTMWVADWTDDKIYAYRMSDKTHDSGKDFNTLVGAGNEDPTGIWSDGTTMWVADSTDAKVYAYWMFDKVRDDTKDFNTLDAAGNNFPNGIWSDGDTMWVADSTDDKVYSYNVPPSSDATLRALTVSPRDIIGFAADRTTYEVGVASTETRATIAAIATHSAASVAYSPTDADTSTTVHDGDLSAGRNAVTVTVTAQDGSTTKDYTVSVNRGVTDNYGWKAVDDLDGLIAAGNDIPFGIWSDGATTWVVDATDDKIYAYNTDGTRDSSKDFGSLVGAGNEDPTGIWSDGATMWVADWTDDKIYAYRMSDKARDSSEDFDMLEMAKNDVPFGIWSDGATMWVADTTDGKIYAYRMSDKTHDSGKDFNTLGSSNDRPTGIWSDGDTMWVADWTDGKLYAYRMFDKARDSSKDFNMLAAANNGVPFGISSEGFTMWVSDANDDKVYSYNMPITVSFEQAAYAVAEGGAVTVRVTLSADPERTVTVPITTTDQGGATGADYSGVPLSVTFNAGETAQTFAFTATDDGEDDDDESVRLAFGALPTGVTAGSTATGIVSITDADDPSVAVSFEQAAYAVAEGGAVTVRVTLSADPERTVTVPITTTDQGGATGADYSGVPLSVTFNAGETAQTFAFTATDDGEDDDDESVRLAFGALPTGVTAGSTATGIVSITDADDPSVAVSFEQAAYAVAEGGAVTVRVTLSADPERTVTVPITTTDQGGATGADYSGVPLSVTFNAGETAQTFAFTATDDGEDDDDESVRLAFGALPTGVTAGSTATGIVSITDADDPSVAVSFEQAAYAVAEGGAVTVRVTLSADPERTVTVPITTTDQGGATGADYSGVPLSVTFNAGETAQTFAFTATDDGEDDDDESVRLAFGALPTGVTAGSTATGIVSITDADDPSVAVSFEQAAYAVAEGGAVTVRVTLSADPERTVTVPITTTDQGGATGADYSGVPLSVTFNAGETAQTFAFTATDDGEDDDDESVRLAFGALPTGVTAGSTATGIVSITDADDPSVAVSFEQAAYAVAEGGAVTVRVTLSADPERTVTVPITTTDQGGATGADYSGVPLSVTFNAGETAQTFAFTATDDGEDDDDESVRLAFGALPTGVTAGSTATGIVSITDADDPSVAVSFEQAAYAVAEGGAVTVRVTLSADPERTVTVPITTTDQGGATGADYSGVPLSVTFNAGETAQTFAFTATDDGEDDDDESVRLAFGALPTGVTAGSTATGIVSITDADDPSVAVSFEQAAYAVAEGGAVTVRVTLSADPERTVTVPITTTDQGGATGADYSGVPLSVTFNAGETAQTFAFTATDDGEDDDDESVRLAFGALPTGVTAGSTATGIVSITDADDPSVAVSFEQAAYAVAEGGAVTVRVTLSADPERTVTVPITTTDQGGATGADYSGVPLSVTFNAGETAQTFAFTATDDGEDDDDESVRLAFGALPTGVTAGSTATGIVSITDADDPSVAVSFEQAAYAVAEGGAVTVRVTLSADPERTVTVPITTTDQGGATGADYSGVPLSVTFNAGETAQTFAFTATDDGEDDDDESVRLAFGALPTGVTAGSTATGIVSITDADDPSVAVSFEQAAYAVAEGGAVTVRVTLSADPERTVTVPITTTDQGGATGADYSGVPLSVTFNAGETAQTFAFTATDDGEDDDDESVRLAFGALPTGVTAGSTATGIVSITDADDPSVAVSFEQAAYAVAEGGAVTVRVTLSADPERTVTVPITTTDQGGATGADYSGVPLSVTFNAGETAQTFAFTATDDGEDDDDESVRLAFGALPTGVTAGSTATGIVSITDADDPSVAVSFEQAAYSATEGGSDAEVTVRLSVPAPRHVDIP